MCSCSCVMQYVRCANPCVQGYRIYIQCVQYRTYNILNRKVSSGEMCTSYKYVYILYMMYILTAGEQQQYHNQIAADTRLRRTTVSQCIQFYVQLQQSLHHVYSIIERLLGRLLPLANLIRFTQPKRVVYLLHATQCIDSRLQSSII